MPGTWTPENSAPLIEAQEDERDIGASVAVSIDAPSEVTGLRWVAVPALPAQAAVVVNGAKLNITFPHFGGVWPVYEIRYLLDKVPGVCQVWADLPAAAEEVIAYRKDASGMREITLSVTATFKLVKAAEQPTAEQATTAPPETSSTVEEETRHYVIRLYPNYTPGRDALVEAVDARR